MKSIVILLLFVLWLGTSHLPGQTPKPGDQDAAADVLFKKANDQLEKKNYSEALSSYQALLKMVPDDPAVLYNGGFAAMLSGDDSTAVTLWTHLRQIDPLDWQVRAKLIQAYQRLGSTDPRDKERSDLIELWKAKKNKQLSEQIEFCRDRFQAAGLDVLAFEVFEFKGPQGRRYVFSIMDSGGKEDYRITLSSSDMDNELWRELTKPTPPKGQRLFYMDGYFKNGGHATYGMMVGEPTYEATKKMVVDILEKKTPPVSATVPSKP